MSWPTKTPAQSLDKKTLGKGVFRKCDGCGETHPAQTLIDSFEVCPSCGFHHRLDIAGWRKLLLDDGELEEWDDHLDPTRPAGVLRRQEATRIASPRRRRTTRVDGRRRDRSRARSTAGPSPTARSIFAFMGGSMGSVVGEKVTRLFERARRAELPVVLLQASGGARMQEGILSLMQMAKIVGRARAAARGAASRSSPCCSHPTTGGVAASFALPRRRQHRRAEGAHRLRGPARHRDDDPPEASRGLPALASSCSSTG